LYTPKGPEGAKKIFKVLRNNKYAAVLADQKLNEGKLINFLGHPAKTATAIAEFSIKLSLPIIPVHVERINGPTFKYIVEKPLKIPDKNLSHEEKVLYILNEINDVMSKWILKNPEQWLWIHNRWG
jgi:KDO2-lipid IV(A) lauroyltransferase